MIDRDQFQWQMHWRSWGFSFTKQPDCYTIGDIVQAEWDNVYLIVGPLQMKWRKWKYAPSL